MCVVPQFVSVCVWVCAHPCVLPQPFSVFVRACVCQKRWRACLQTLTPGVSPQACAGGEEEECEEGGGGTEAHLMEVLRQFRLHHRGQYRTVLEESLASYHLQGEEGNEGRSTSGDGVGGDDGDEDMDGQSEERPASRPSPLSPPSPPPSPAMLEPNPSQQTADPEPSPPST